MSYFYQFNPSDYLDIDFLGWLIWLFTPIMITFLLPMIIVLLLYMSALIIHVYRYRHRLKDAYARDFLDGARYTVAAMWEGVGWIWNGYEMHGMENIPKTGPALLVYYHGALPADYYFIMAKIYLNQQRMIRTVGDRFLFKVPGWKLMMDVLRVIPGSIQSCVQILNEGNLLAIAPGGVFEAQFGDEYYKLLWGNRIGFAKVAVDAKVPVIPIFTENIREAFRTLSCGRTWIRKLYDKYRLPFVPIYGFFPVKLRTYVGKPIPYDPSITAEQLAERTATSIEDLIHQHQRIPGSILMSLIQRVYMRKNNLGLKCESPFQSNIICYNRRQ